MSEKLSLEQKIAKLEEYAAEIEKNDIPLENALGIFEKSVKLASECMQTLNDCNGKLTVLQNEVKRLTDEN